MYLKKIGKVLTSKSAGTRLLSYEKGIYWAAVSQRLRNTALVDSSQVVQELSSFSHVWCQNTEMSFV